MREEIEGEGDMEHNKGIDGRNRRREVREVEKERERGRQGRLREVYEREGEEKVTHVQEQERESRLFSCRSSEEEEEEARTHHLPRRLWGEKSGHHFRTQFTQFRTPTLGQIRYILV